MAMGYGAGSGRRGHGAPGTAAGLAAQCVDLADRCDDLACEIEDARGNRTAAQAVLNASANLHDAGAMLSADPGGRRSS